MGEEKPEEELMGKRKPSPRLSATCSIMLLTLVWTSNQSLYVNKKS